MWTTPPTVSQPGTPKYRPYYCVVGKQRRKSNHTKDNALPARAEIHRERRFSDLRPHNKAGFAAELGKQIALHDETPVPLLKAITKSRESYAQGVIRHWVQGKTIPRNPSSFRLLTRIERRYGLPADYFRSILWPESPKDRAIRSVTANQQHIMRCHLPADFDKRLAEQRTEILGWVRENVLSGSTEFGRYCRQACASRYVLRLPTIGDVPAQARFISRFCRNAGEDNEAPVPSRPIGTVEAPPHLIAESTKLVEFKRAPLALPGYSRNSGWSQYTAS